MDKLELVGIMHSKGDTQADLAKACGLSLSRFNAKLNETDGAEFTKKEMQCIKDRYELADDKFMQIFFPSLVS